MRVRRRVTTAAQMRALGRAIGEIVGPGTLICLYGDLGAGKTTLTQGIAVGMGIPAREIASASFVLCAEHTEGRCPLYHVDLYRLDPDEVEPAGLTEYFSSDGVAVVEWAERAEGLFPPGCIEIRIAIEGRERDVVIRAPGRLVLPEATCAAAGRRAVSAG